MHSVLPWILFAVLVASLLHFNHDLVLSTVGPFLLNDFSSPFFLSIISFPLYLCAGADIAMSQEFLELGVSAGAVFAFMTASPGVNFTTFVVYKQAFDFRTAVLITVFPIIIITALGMLFNIFF